MTKSIKRVSSRKRRRRMTDKDGTGSKKRDRGVPWHVEIAPDLDRQVRVAMAEQGIRKQKDLITFLLEGWVARHVRDKKSD